MSGTMIALLAAGAALAGTESPKVAEREEAWARLQRMVGDWEGETTVANGMPLRARFSLAPTLEGRFLAGDGWLAVGEGAPWGHHSRVTFGYDPESDSMHVWNFSDVGGVTVGAVRPHGDRGLEVDWTTNAGEGVEDYLVRYTFGEDGGILTEIFAPEADGERRRMVEVPYRRREAPGAGEADAPAALVKEVVVPATRAEVWRAWTTDEGARMFLSPWTRIEARPGGAFEIYFSDEAPEGQRGSEGCVVASLAPEEMLGFTWSAPPQFAACRAQRTLVVVRLEDDPGGTRVRLEQTGWGPGEEWSQVRAYFDKAWPYVLGNLRARFETGRSVFEQVSE